MLIPIIAITFVSTFAGGLLGLRFKDRLHQILGFTAGVILGVVAFDILPEIAELTTATGVPFLTAMIALVTGFLTLHIFEKVLLIHGEHEETYSHHKHATVGAASVVAMAAHTFLDGVGIGLGFQVSPELGVLIAVAVIAHAFSDGLNTIAVMLISKNTQRRALMFLCLVAVAPILGALSVQIFTLADEFIIMYLGFFAGSLLYICSAEILPEAHSEHPSLRSIGMTLIGVVFIFIVSQIAHI